MPIDSLRAAYRPARFAPFTSIAGVLALAFAALFARWLAMGRVTGGERAILACAVVYGVGQIVSSYFLRRSDASARTLQILVSVLALGAIAFVAMRRRAPVEGLMALAPFAALAVVSLFYFTREGVFDGATEALRRATPLAVVDVVAAGLLFLLAQQVPLGYPEKRTMSDMRTLATAIESYATDHNAYPQQQSMDDLERTLVPTYIKVMPRQDGWRYPFRYSGSKDHYTIASSRSDLVYSDGAFVNAPRKSNFDEATAVYRKGDYKAAIEGFEDVVRDNPRNALALARLGVSYCNVGRFADAIPILKRAIDLDATDYQSRSNLALAYQRIGQADAGLQFAREAARLQPKNADVIGNLGFVLLEAHKFAEAVPVLQQAVRMRPSNAQFHYELAQAWLGSGNIEQARLETVAVRRLDPELAKKLDAKIR